MRFLAILAVLFGVTAGAIALGDPDARPVPRRLRIPISSVSDRELFTVVSDGSKPSGIQGLPIPARAVRAHGDEQCDERERCDEETWTLRGLGPSALRDWYADRIEGDEPWRGMRSCGAVDDGKAVHYRWVNESRRLELQVIDGRTIVLRDQPFEDLPCN